jgi:hypothetical protein
VTEAFKASSGSLDCNVVDAGTTKGHCEVVGGAMIVVEVAGAVLAVPWILGVTDELAL